MCTSDKHVMSCGFFVYVSELFLKIQFQYNMWNNC